MTSVNLSKSMALFGLSVLLAGSLGFGCGKDSNTGSEGGSGGNDDEGGNGGSDEGGKGGGAAGKGGSAGGAQGGNGGGGTAGAAPFVAPTKCGPGSTNKGGIIGPVIPWSGPKKQTLKYKVEKLAAAGMLAEAPVYVWIPPKYETAKDGEVAVMLMSEVMGMDGNFIGQIEDLMANELMPPTILTTNILPANSGETPGKGPIDWGLATDVAGNNAKSRAAKLGEVMAAIKAKYPKLSNDPKMHALVGQSTAGGVAFDMAWARPDLFGKVYGASPSFAVFQQWLYPYAQKVDASNKDKIRFALDVGECDLVWEADLIAPACKANICKDLKDCICVGCGDANWPEMNKALTQKLLDLGYKTQLLIRKNSTHSQFTNAAPDDLTFLWRDIVCPEAS